MHTPFKPVTSSSSSSSFLCADFSAHAPGLVATPDQLRWGPLPMPAAATAAESSRVDFIAGLKTLAGCGDAANKEGLAIHMVSNLTRCTLQLCHLNSIMIVFYLAYARDGSTEITPVGFRLGSLAAMHAAVVHLFGALASASSVLLISQAAR
jgi:homogentisate 1,2-dioxygenase